VRVLAQDNQLSINGGQAGRTEIADRNFSNVSSAAPPAQPILFDVSPHQSYTPGQKWR